MAAVVERIRLAIAEGRRITVHGDYDADGVCSTAILVARAPGPRAPSATGTSPTGSPTATGCRRRASSALAERGTGLLITTDCGIACPTRSTLAEAAGIEVIVTDHHQPGERAARLPDPPPAGQRLSVRRAVRDRGRLQARRRRCAAARRPTPTSTSSRSRPSPTWSRCSGENRALVRGGLEEARRGRRPGLRALMAAAKIEPERLDEGDSRSGSAPRINAAGRLYRADAGVELMLTDDRRAPRRSRPSSTAPTASAARPSARSWPAPRRPCASCRPSGRGAGPRGGRRGLAPGRRRDRRLADGRAHRAPGDPDRRRRGRARPRLRAQRPGLRPARRPRRLLRAPGPLRRPPRRGRAGDRGGAASPPSAKRSPHTPARRSGDEPRRAAERIDAVVGAESWAIDVAEELERLGAVRQGQPAGPPARPRGAGCATCARWARTSRHARFSLESGARARAGRRLRCQRPLGAGGRGRANGRLGEPRAQPLERRGRAPGRARASSTRGRPTRPASTTRARRPRNGRRGGSAADSTPAEASTRERRTPGRSAGRTARASSTAAARSGVAADRRAGLERRAGARVCADALRRRALVERAAPRQRVRRRRASRSPRRAADEAAARRSRCRARGRRASCSPTGRAGARPAGRGASSTSSLIDPPPFAALEAARGPPGAGYLHLAWGPAEVELAARLLGCRVAVAAGARRALPRAAATRRRGEAGSRRELRCALAAAAAHPRSPGGRGRALRVLLASSGSCAVGRDPALARALRVVSSEGTDLERSRAYRAYRARHEEGKRFLSRRRQTRS